MTFIDPSTGWFEITEIKNKNTVNISHKVDVVWLTRYPRPRKIISDNGAEFKKVFRTISTDYGVKLTKTTVKNPQANGVLERVHLTICNMLRAKKLAELEMPADDPWTAILASVAYAMRSTYHTTLQATPAQLIFRRDMIYPVEYVAEWDVLRQKKQKQIDKNNHRENSRQIDFDYRVGQKILIINTNIQRKLDNPTTGPYKITDVFQTEQFAFAAAMFWNALTFAA